ncbi:hypothetical protein APHAL10511_007902 [Amanita phalloides]|nr:hypothetical protein APHAL10511_007902 [Amanita phalloides]
MGISESSDPGYGQLQVDLYMVILRDALARIRLINVKSGGERSAMKRKLSHDADNAVVKPRFKKPRTRAKEQKIHNPTEDARLIMLREVDRRDLALLRLEYGVFNSPSSMALYRLGRVATSWASDGPAPPGKTKKRVFTPEEYFRITLTSEIAKGATGKVHDAKIEGPNERRSRSRMSRGRQSRT